jgi:hypothetical protein
MTVMRFDSHRGWYNPRPDLASRPYRADAPFSGGYGSASYRAPDPRKVDIAKRDFNTLLDQARSGDLAAQAELRLRGNNPTR